MKEGESAVSLSRDRTQRLIREEAQFVYDALKERGHKDDDIHVIAREASHIALDNDAKKAKRA